MVKPCPICGKSDEVRIDTEESYYYRLGKNGSACVCIECNRCFLTLYDHSMDTQRYTVRLGRLIKKWNSMWGVKNEGVDSV